MLDSEHRSRSSRAEIPLSVCILREPVLVYLNICKSRGSQAVAKEDNKQEIEDVETAGVRKAYLVPDEERILRTLNLGQRLALARQNKGLTQKQLSELVGKSRATVVQYEQGRLQPPLQQIETMAKVLGVPPETIAFGRSVEEKAATAWLPELELTADGERATGRHAFASSLAEHLGAEPNAARIYVLGVAAPAFGLARGDRLIVNVGGGLDGGERLHAFRTASGVSVARLVPQLSTTSRRINLIGGHGETTSHDPGELALLGLVVGSIQAR